MASAGVIWSDILGDLLTFGEMAVNIFVKNPEHAATAQNIVKAVNVAIPIVQSQITPANPTGGPVATTNPVTN